MSLLTDFFDVITGKASAQQAEQARDDASKNASLDREAAKKRAAAQLKLDKKIALNQQRSALSSLQLSSAQASAQAKAQLQQQFLAQTQLMGQQALIVEQQFREKESRDNIFFREARQTLNQQDRQKRVRRRDTILTSPIAGTEDPNSIQVKF